MASSSVRRSDEMLSLGGTIESQRFLGLLVARHWLRATS